jgi:NTP pyrophosphatase (non-canonical NTP hydrolase)
VPLDLRDFQAAVGVWQSDVFGDHRDPTTKAGKVCEEAGEVMGAVIRLLEAVPRATLQDVAGEAGDVVISLAGLSELLGFDLDVAIAERWADVRGRDFADVHTRAVRPGARVAALEAEGP